MASFIHCSGENKRRGISLPDQPDRKSKGSRCKPFEPCLADLSLVQDKPVVSGCQGRWILKSSSLPHRILRWWRMAPGAAADGDGSALSLGPNTSKVPNSSSPINANNFGVFLLRIFFSLCYLLFSLPFASSSVLLTEPSMCPFKLANICSYIEQNISVNIPSLLLSRTNCPVRYILPTQNKCFVMNRG